MTQTNQEPQKTSSFKRAYAEFRVLLDNVPPVTLNFFVLSVFAMNLMANKAIELPFEWLALDCGILVSWVAFLSMDMLTKYFGPKAASELSLYATFMNIIACIFFYFLGTIPGVWGESFTFEGQEFVVNTVLNNTFKGTWFIILGSTIAFVSSAFINNFLNYAIGKLFKKNPDGLAAYLISSYGSTFIGQFADNFIFAFLVARTFFGWSLVQCVNCSFFGMLVELLCEVIFSFFGYKIIARWKKQNVGQGYFDYLKREENQKG